MKHYPKIFKFKNSIIFTFYTFLVLLSIIQVKNKQDYYTDGYTYLGGAERSCNHDFIISRQEYSALWSKKKIYPKDDISITFNIKTAPNYIIYSPFCIYFPKFRTYIYPGYAILLRKSPNYLSNDNKFISDSSGLGYYNMDLGIVIELDFLRNQQYGDIGENTMSIRDCRYKKCSYYENTYSTQTVLKNYELNKYYSEEHYVQIKFSNKYICAYFKTDKIDNYFAKVCKLINMFDYFSDGFYFGVSSYSFGGRKTALMSVFYNDYSVDELNIEVRQEKFYREENFYVYVQPISIIHGEKHYKQVFYDVNKFSYSFSCLDSIVKYYNSDDKSYIYKVSNCKHLGTYTFTFKVNNVQQSKAINIISRNFAFYDNISIIKNNKEVCNNIVNNKGKKYVLCNNKENISFDEVGETITLSLFTFTNLMYPITILKKDVLVNLIFRKDYKDFDINESDINIINNNVLITIKIQTSGLYDIYSYNFKNLEYNLSFITENNNIYIDKSNCSVENRDLYSDKNSYTHNDKIRLKCVFKNINNKLISKSFLEKEFKNNNLAINIINNNKLYSNFTKEIIYDEGNITFILNPINVNYGEYELQLKYKDTLINSNENIVLVKLMPKSLKNISVYFSLNSNTEMQYSKFYESIIRSNNDYGIIIKDFDNKSFLNLSFFNFLDKDNNVINYKHIMSSYIASPLTYTNVFINNRNKELGEYSTNKLKITYNYIYKKFIISLNDSTYLRRSSYIYDINLFIKGNEEEKVTIPIKLDIETDNRIASHHKFNSKNSVVTNYINDNLTIKVGDKTPIFKIEYRTDINTLYNYNYYMSANDEQIYFDNDNYHEVKCINSIRKDNNKDYINKFGDIFKIIRTSVDGVFNLIADSGKKNVCILKLKDDKGNIISGKEYKITIEHDDKVYGINIFNEHDKNEYSIDNNPVISKMYIYDRYVNYFDIPIPNNNYGMYGINMSLEIINKSGKYIEDNPDKDLLILKQDDNNKEIYTLIDNYTKPGKYTVTFSYKYYNNVRPQIISYYKVPGKADNEKSIIKLGSSSRLDKLDERITILIDLRDKYNNLLSEHNKVYKQEIKKIKINIYNENNDSMQLINYEEDKSKRYVSYLTFITDPIKELGKYKFEGYIIENTSDGKEIAKPITCENDCQVIFSMKEFEFINTKIFIATNELIELNDNHEYIINKSNMLPVFIVKFYNDQKDQVFRINSVKDIIKVKLENISNDLNISLDVSYTQDKGDITIDFSVIKEQYENLQQGEYNLVIYYNINNTQLKIIKPLYIIDNELDINNNQTNQNIDYSKTSFSKTIINTYAGEENTITVDLRDINRKLINNNNNNVISTDNIKLKAYHIENNKESNEVKIDYILVKGPNNYEQLIIDFIIYKEGAFKLFIIDYTANNDTNNNNNNTTTHKNLGKHLDVYVKGSALYKFVENINEDLLVKDDNNNNNNNNDIVYKNVLTGQTIDILFNTYDKFNNINNDIFTPYYTEEDIINMFDIQNIDVNNNSIIKNDDNSTIKVIRNFSNKSFVLSITTKLKCKIKITSLFLINDNNNNNNLKSLYITYKSNNISNINVMFDKLYLQYNTTNKINLVLYDSYFNKANNKLLDEKLLTIKINNNEIKLTNMININYNTVSFDFTLLPKLYINNNNDNKDNNNIDVNYNNINNITNIICNICNLPFIIQQLDLNNSVLIDVYTNNKLSSKSNNNNNTINNLDYNFINIFKLELYDVYNSLYNIDNDKEFNSYEFKAYYSRNQNLNDNNDNNNVKYLEDNKEDDILINLCVRNLKDSLLIYFCNGNKDFSLLNSKVSINSLIVLNIESNNNTTFKQQYIINLTSNTELDYSFNTSVKNKIDVHKSVLDQSDIINTVAGQYTLNFLQLRDSESKDITQYNIDNIKVNIYNYSNVNVQDNNNNNNACDKQLLNIRNNGLILLLVKCNVADIYKISLFDINNDNKNNLSKLVVKAGPAYKLLFNNKDLNNKTNNNIINLNDYNILSSSYLTIITVLDKYNNRATIKNISLNIKQIENTVTDNSKDMTKFNLNNIIQTSFVPVSDNGFKVILENVKYTGKYEIECPLLNINNKIYFNIVNDINSLSFDHSIINVPLQIKNNDVYKMQFILKDKYNNNIILKKSELDNLEFLFYYRYYYKSFSYDNKNDNFDNNFLSNYHAIKNLDKGIVVDSTNNILVLSIKLLDRINIDKIEFRVLGKFNNNNNNNNYNSFGNYNSITKLNTDELNIHSYIYNCNSNVFETSSFIYLEYSTADTTNKKNLMIKINEDNFNYSDKPLNELKSNFSLSITSKNELNLNDNNNIKDINNKFNLKCYLASCYYSNTDTLNIPVGEYTLTINYSGNVVYTIDLNVVKDIDIINNTVVNNGYTSYKNLKSLASSFEYSIVQIRNVYNYTVKNNNNNLKLIYHSDKFNEKVIYSSISNTSIQGTYLIKFSSYVSNSFPFLNLHNVDLVYNNKTLTTLNPVFYPLEMSLIRVLEDNKYIKVNEDNNICNLNSITVDNNKIINISAYDIYNNLTIVDINALNPDVKLKSNPSIKLKFKSYISNGYYASFKIYSSKSDTYIFKSLSSKLKYKKLDTTTTTTSDNNNNNNNDNSSKYIDTEFTIVYNATAGKINANTSLFDFSKSSEVNKTITATLTLYDTFSNNILETSTLNIDKNILVTLLTPDNNIINISNNYKIIEVNNSNSNSNETVRIEYYINELHIAGLYKFNVYINNKIKYCKDCNFIINAGKANPDKVIPYCINNNNNNNIQQQQYYKCQTKLNNKMYYDQPLKIRLFFYDDFNNIANIQDIDSVKGILTGRNMVDVVYSIDDKTSDKSLDVTDNNNFIDLSMNKYNYKSSLVKENYQRLVSGPGYTLKLYINNKSYSSIDLPFYIIKQTDDRKWGNNNYNIKLTKLHIEKTLNESTTGCITKKVSDNEYHLIRQVYQSIQVNIKLYSQVDLLYNYKFNDINKVIKIKNNLNNEEITTISSINQIEYGDISLEFMYKEITTLSNPITLSIYIENSKTPLKILLTTKAAYPPYSASLLLLSNKSYKDSYLAGEELLLNFKIQDKYENYYINDVNILNQLKLTINDSVQEEYNLKIKENNNNNNNNNLNYSEYYISYTVKYPPNTQYLNLIDINQSNKKLLKEDLKIKVESTFSPEYTRINGDNLTTSIAGEKLDMSIYLFDSTDNCYEPSEDFSFFSFEVSLTGPLQSKHQKTVYYNTAKRTKINNKINICDYKMQLDIQDNEELLLLTKAGKYKLGVKINGVTVINEDEFTHIVRPSAIDINNIKSIWNMKGSFSSSSIPAGTQLFFDVIVQDKYGNVPDVSLEDELYVKILDYDDNSLILDEKSYSNNNNNNNNNEFVNSITKQIDSEGIIKYELLLYKAKTYKIFYLFNNNEVPISNNNESPSIINVVAGECSNKYTEFNNKNNSDFNTDDYPQILIGQKFSVNFTCKDNYNNVLSNSEANFKVLFNIRNENGAIIDDSIKGKITSDNSNNNGIYTISTIPYKTGRYFFSIMLDKNTYGDEMKFTVTNTICSGDTPIECPNNKNKCVSNIHECRDNISIENCKDLNYPFYCTGINGKNNCFKSITDCSCPSGYSSCSLRFPIRYCIESSKVSSLCPFYLPIRCSSKIPNTVQCTDGICRKNKQDAPNTRVCPLGSILCPDLTCRNNLSECSKVTPCPLNKQVCLDSSCVDDISECPSLITCKNDQDVVCPDGECVKNELQCKKLPICHKPNEYLCRNNICVKSKDHCPKTIVCGHGKALCSDMICKESCK